MHYLGFPSLGPSPSLYRGTLCIGSEVGLPGSYPRYLRAQYSLHFVCNLLITQMISFFASWFFVERTCTGLLWQGHSCPHERPGGYGQGLLGGVLPLSLHCPEGADSWCKYQRALALNQDTPPHTPKIPTDFVLHVKQVFQDLCSEKLLQKCLLGATQNRNESFNNLVWARAPKTEYVTRASVTIAVSQAVLVFNSGSQALLPILQCLEVHPSHFCIAYLKKRDDTRMKRAQKHESDLAKKRRKSKRLVDKTAEEMHIEQEGMTYGAGQF